MTAASVPTPDGLAEVDDIARLLMAAWEKAEGKPVTPSYVATFADMALALAPWVAQRDAQQRAEALRPFAGLAANDCSGCFSEDHPCGDPVCALKADLRDLLARADRIAPTTETTFDEPVTCVCSGGCRDGFDDEPDPLLADEREAIRAHVALSPNSEPSEVEQFACRHCQHAYGAHAKGGCLASVQTWEGGDDGYEPCPCRVPYGYPKRVCTQGVSDKY